MEGLEILLDRDLGAYETVYPAAGTDATGVPLTLNLLKEITGGRVVDLRPETDSAQLPEESKAQLSRFEENSHD